ncbi:glutamate ABC transporter substrate-binding protein [Labedaea rhizosphaerae]|nr:glutamate ABC transporter substrate-binding protein [Labedaea rhizosphaerae]
MRKLFGALAAALALAGCSSSLQPVDPAPAGAVQQPQPAGVGGGEPSDTASTSSCDPNAISLRPSGSLPAPGQFPAGSRLKKIHDRGYLRAGIDQNTYLFGFRNLTTNQMEGFDIDRVREIAKAIFGDPDKVQFKVITSKEREAALAGDEVDVVARTYSVTCARAKIVDFSAVYYTAGQRVLVDRRSKATSLDDLAGKKVCAASGSTSIKKLTGYPSKPVPVSVPTYADCLIMLQQGQVDAVSTDDTILAGMVKQDPNLKMVGKQITEEPYGIGIKKGDDNFVRFVNGVLQQSISSGAWQASYNKWLRGTGEEQPVPTLRYRD